MLDFRPQKIASQAIRRPRLTIAVLVSMVAVAVPGLLRLEVRTDGHALIPPDDPVVARDAEIRGRFGLRDPIVVLIETSHPEGIYNPETLAAVQEISDALVALDGVEARDVTSLATENRDRVRPGTLNFRPYLDPFPDTAKAMDTLRGDVDAAEILHGTMLSPGAEAVSILVRLPESGGGTSERIEFYRTVRELVATYETETDRVLVVGAPVAEALLGTHVLEDLRVLLPLALTVIAAVVWIGCRRFWGVALALGEVGACLLFTFGWMGWLGFPVYLTTAVLPVILTTIGLADEIHIFWHYQRLLALDSRSGTAGSAAPARTAALERTMAEMSRPVVLSSLTTSLAFLSFLASPIAPVSSFGIFAAVGTLFCMVWSLTVIPASLALISPEKMRREAAVPGSRLRILISPFLARPARTVAVLLLVTAGLGLGAGRLYVQDSWIEGFAPASEFRRASARANELLHGTHTLLAHLTFDPPSGEVPRGVDLEGPLLSPELLRALGELEDFLRERPEVGGVLGTHSHLTTVAYLWRGRREGTRVIPDRPGTVERVLNRFDQGRGEHRRREVLDDDLRRTVVTIFLEEANYRDTEELMGAVAAWVDQHLAEFGARLEFAGDVAVSQAMIPAIVRTQVSSLLLALAAALVVLCVLYRSLATGMLVVLPTCCAVLWVFGLMGWSGIPLGVATSMFCAITLGIGVDYGIHFIERFRRRGDGGSALDAVEEAGPAILADAAAIALGFGLLAISQVPANARLGLLVAGALLATSVLTLAGLSALLSTRVRGAIARVGGPAFWLAAVFLTASCRAPSPAADPSDFASAMNVGKAYLENRESASAVDAFAQAVAIDRDSPAAHRNLARAHLLARDAGAALAALETASELERDSAATSYLLGIAHARESRFADALPHLEEAVRLDAENATLRFQLASAYQTLGRKDEAVEQLEVTLRLDPLHTSALYKLASFARLTGDRELFAARQREWTRLRQLLGEESRTPEALERCVYTLAEPPPVEEPGAEEVPALAVTFTEVPLGAFAEGMTAAAVLDVDPRGIVNLFAAGGKGGSALLTAGPDGAWEEVRIELGAETALGPGITVAAGNFQDQVPEDVHYDPETHAHPDVLLLGEAGARLLRGTVQAERFVDVTGPAGLLDLQGHRARWADYDHDGDLDLLVARPEGLELWQNNGNGTFQDVTAAAGIVDTGPVDDVAAVDLDGDVAIDLLVARGDLPTLVLENRRTGSFAVRPDPPGPWPAARRVLADDLDNDGRLDAVLVGTAEAVLVYGGRAERRRLDLGDLRPEAGLLFDYDNDGRLDLCLAGPGGLRLWRNGADWRDVTAETDLAGLSLERPRELVAADFDGDADTDLLLVTAAGFRSLRNDGGHVHGQLKIRLQGTKTNPGGLGSRVEVRHENFWVARSVSELPIEIGLGGRDWLDSVQTVWTNGVVDNEIGVEVPATPLTILEKNVAAGSCPFLYAWDGESFRFVTDLLGNSPVGLSIRRGEPLAADPDELVEIGGAVRFQPRKGRYVVQVTEEMREVLYLDHARLIAVDHPPGVEIHPTDKLMPPPFPASELWPLASPRVPRRAVGDDGVDRTGALRALDGRFAPPGTPLPPPLRGVSSPLSIELDFGELPADRPVVLALTGWLQYGDASTNIALSQNPDRAAVPPVLEVGTADGDRRRLEVTVGVPAGKTKTILVDLAGKLPPGSWRLWLTTSLEIRWDRIALFERLPASAVVRHEAPPSAASLSWRGFSEIRSRAPGHPTTPAFETVSPRPPWRTALAGWSTRYGDVLPLVTARDERLAILNAGDALELEFDSSAFPPPAAGTARTFFFYSVGWDKDGDYNVIAGDSVEPLPVASAEDDWQVRYNTRWVPRDRFVDAR